MKLHATIKQLRKQQNIRQEHMAEQLCMARSTYSKLESGVTAMPVETLVKIASILRVSVYDLMQEDGSQYVQWIDDRLSLMLHLVENTLSYERLTAVPYDDLTFPQLKMLAAKGMASREAYENTPLGGRLHSFGPRDVFSHMMRQLGMSMLFEEKLVQDPYWLVRWKDYQDTHSGPELSWAGLVDEQEYFIVYIWELTMPDGATRVVQIAERDFPDGLDVEAALQCLVTQEGAVSGAILAFTDEGYDPVSEIIKMI
ncbi:helix-turn-helix transcriptional regulator [Hymenobacter sp. BT664]|uniref:Helix-turn-helix transcriptional regulator n=1 Tax=Hymenobacter montanus TaxID=2771359 RepID=A0A927BFN8_9BACT|nr:helix-turn-helix transcriptional regulator [Hymenobacter montanus]MBD2769410.1 helix-turn-helix transcriptional regulator [Hymenobacter montanus]